MSHSFRKVDEEVLRVLRELVGEEQVSVDREVLEDHGHDETEDLSFPPEVVIRPGSTKEISSVLAYANEQGVPVTPIGARTGLSGGALSVHGGIGLSMSRFDRILNIDEKNLQATVQPGVITQVFQEAVAEKGLMYPPDPASRGSCFIGGNLAENSGGPRAVKYGVTSDFVLDLELVLPNGSVIRTGAQVLKNATGYDLTHLLVGSEGTLGIITEAVMKLVPHPQDDLLMFVPFSSPEKACEAVASVFQEKVIPSALEFMERDMIDRSIEHIGEDPIGLGEEVQAVLLVEVDGNEREQLVKDCERIMEVMERHGSGELLFAEDAQQKEKLWKIRKVAGEAAKAGTIYKEEDTVVPRYELPKLLKHVKALEEEFGFRSYSYGHAGDGNLHINIVKAGLSEEQWQNEIPKAVRRIFEYVRELGGTISGEHGIGHVQRPYVDIVFSEEQLRLFRGVKESFDPRGILNPDKIF
ncbi:MAG: FAD-binding oxidoreductase [Flavobacteriales bacterium]